MIHDFWEKLETRTTFTTPPPPSPRLGPHFYHFAPNLGPALLSPFCSKIAPLLPYPDPLCSHFFSTLTATKIHHDSHAARSLSQSIMPSFVPLLTTLTCRSAADCAFFMSERVPDTAFSISSRWRIAPPKASSIARFDYSSAFIFSLRSCATLVTPTHTHHAHTRTRRIRPTHTRHAHVDTGESASPRR